MQPTDEQVRSSLRALQERTSAVQEREAAAQADVPDGVLGYLAALPSLRDDRLTEARARLEAGDLPSDADLASRMVGRIVCDRLR